MSAVEEPLDDLFCDIIPTHRGNFRIFPRKSMYAGLNTQILIRALESASTPTASQPTLDAVYSLLRMSDAIAERSQIDGRTASKGESRTQLRIPNDLNEDALASRVNFTDTDLRIMGIDVQHLDQFLLRLTDLPLIGSNQVGNSAIELRPLIRFRDVVYVLSVETISLAIRARIIDDSRKVGSRFCYAAQKLQERYAALTDFLVRSPANSLAN